MLRKLIFLLLLSGVAGAQGLTSIAVNTPVANPFSFSTSIYQTSWNASSLIKFHGDCYQFWRTAAAHVTPPAYIGFWKQVGCTGPYVAYGGASQDIGGGSCSGGPSGTLFCDNTPNNNSVTGCSLGIDTHNDKLVCIFYDDNSTGSASVGLYFSVSGDGATWTTPTAIPNHYWAGSGFGYMKGATKFCHYATGNSPTASYADVYEMCTTDDSTWTNDKLIGNPEDSEGAVWYDSTGTNGLAIIRNRPSAAMFIGTTTNGGTTWTVGSSNISTVSPSCTVSGGSLTSDSFPAPVLFSPSIPSGQVTLLVLDRQVCTGGGSGSVNNYLLATTFNPLTVIATPSSLPSLELLYTGLATNAQVDCGYAGMMETATTNLMFGWYCDATAFAAKPELFQMTGNYLVSFVGSTFKGGDKISSKVTIK